MRQLHISLLVLFTLLLLPGCQGANETSLEPKNEEMHAPKKVWSTLLTPASEGSQRHLTGTIQAADAVSISFEVTGVVSNMYVDLGQSFQKGDVLAQLDTAVYELAVQQSQSSLGEANAAMLDARQTHDRNHTLRDKGLISQAALDSSIAALDIAEQRTQVAQSALDIAKENLADTELVAPYSGRVSARSAEPSQQVTPGATVLSIQGNAKLEVNAAIPEGLISKVSLFDQVSVIVPSLSTSKTYPATLTEIGAQASIANAFPITITFADNHAEFYPGMSAEIILSVNSVFNSDAYFVIPFSAFTTDKTGPFVYLIEETPNISAREGRAVAKKHYVDIVELKEASAIIKFVQLPLFSSDGPVRIVRTGLDFLRPNQAISIVETSTQIYNQ